jgi:hypothetical protein
MAGATLTDDFWANDILWQLSVFAYNISVMTCRQGRCAKRKIDLNDRFNTSQAHRSGIKTKKGGKYEDQLTQNLWSKYF